MKNNNKEENKGADSEKLSSPSNCNSRMNAENQLFFRLLFFVSCFRGHFPTLPVRKECQRI